MGIRGISLRYALKPHIRGNPLNPNYVLDLARGLGKGTWQGDLARGLGKGTWQGDLARGISLRYALKPQLRSGLGKRDL